MNTALNNIIPSNPQEVVDFGIPTVILCGGQGSRMVEVTGNTMPKHLLEVCGRKMIDFALDPFSKSSKIVLATSVHGKMIADYLGGGTIVPIEYSHQIEPNGVTHDLHRAVSDCNIVGTFAVARGDEVVHGIDMTDMLWFHRQQGSAATLAVTKASDASPDFVFNFDENLRATTLERDPKNLKTMTATPHVGTGIFLCEQSVLPTLVSSSSWEVFVRNLINQLELSCYVTDHKFFNMNSSNEVDAFADFLMRPPVPNGM